MDFISKVTSPVLLHGYVLDIIQQKPHSVRELVVKTLESKNVQLFLIILENVSPKQLSAIETPLIVLAIKSMI